MEILPAPIVSAPPERSTRSGDGTTMWDGLIQFLSSGTHDVTADDGTVTQEPNLGTWFAVAANVTRNQQATLTSTAKKLGWHCTTRLEGEIAPAEGEDVKDIKSHRYQTMHATIDKTLADHKAGVAARREAREAKKAEKAAEDAAAGVAANGTAPENGAAPVEDAKAKARGKQTANA